MQPNLAAQDLFDQWRVTLLDKPRAQQHQAVWAAAEDSIFTCCAYFDLLKQLALPDIHTRVLLFEHPLHGAFGLVLQSFVFDAGTQIGGKGSGGFWQQWTKKQLSRYLRFHILTAGQLLLTGPHGLVGKPAVGDAELAKLVHQATLWASTQWPVPVRGIMLKDLPLGQLPREMGYSELPVQPNMLIELDQEWLNFDDYLQALTSKYRTRVKRARKKGAELQRRLLTGQELIYWQPVMYDFYKGIAEEADFNTVLLPEDYFLQWRTQFPERFHIWGYFHDDQLVGFATAIHNGHETEAHFLGFDHAYNASHQLYLNILLDLLDEAIQHKAQRLILSRTALEIKSSIGAVAENLQCWVRSTSPIINPVVPIVARFLSPVPEWLPRHPFRSEQDE